MKKTMLLVILTLIFLVAVGCSNSNNASQVQENASAANAENNENIKLPEENPDLTGKVKEIIGNEVTVYKMQMPQGQPMNGAEGQQQPQGNKPAVSEGQEGEQGAAMPRITTTEETETFIIPVGTPIVLRQRGSTEVNIVELTEVKKDQILSVWKNGDTVELVQLMGGGGMRSSGGGGQRPPGQGGFPGGMGGRPQ